MSVVPEKRENHDCLVCLNSIKERSSISDFNPHSCEDDLQNEDDYDIINNYDIKTYFLNRLKNQHCNCVYTIHLECLLGWILENPSCPICRSRIITNTYDTPKPIFFTHFFNTTYSVSDGLTQQYLVELIDYITQRENETSQIVVTNNEPIDIPILTIVSRRHNLVVFPIIGIAFFFLILFLILFSFSHP